MSLIPRKSPKALLLTLFAALCFTASMLAQSATTGAIGGTVTDSGGALLPNAVITVTSTETQATRKVKSNSNGEFRVPELTPGTYAVSIVVDGFQTSVTNNVNVTVGNTATITPKLTVGSVSDKVEVSDSAPALHLNDSGITTTIDQSSIDNLPINGRRYSDFALLTPGVVSNSDGFGLLSFRGISYLLNNVTVDGADDNQAYFSEARGRTRSSYTVSQGAVQEFQVNTSNYSAEYGRAAGGVINTVTKSGSNQLHGELFFYDRDNRIGGSTNPYTQIYNFNEATGINPQIVQTKDWRKQYGFGVGGALIKDKLFWFYAFDQEKRNFPGVARTTDPYDMFALARPLSGKENCSNPGGSSYGAPYASYTNPSGYITGPFPVTANLSGGFATSGNEIPASAPYTGVSYYPIGQSYQGNFAACALAVAVAGSTTGSTPNYQAAMAYYNQGLGVLAKFFGYVPRFQDQTINFPKLDYQLNDRNHISAQYNRLRDDSPNGIQTQTSNFYGRGSYGNDYVKADVGIFRVSSVLTNTVVNEFLAQYGRDMESEFPGGPLPAGPLPNEVPLVNPLSPGECSAPHGGGCLAGAPDLSIGYGYDAAGFDGGTSSLLTRFALPDERRLQLKDDVTWSYGKHTFKYGLDYNKVSDYINNLYNGYGTYNFDWAYSFIGDYLHATTGLGGTGYAGGNGTAYPGNPGEVDYNFGLYSSFSQGYTVPGANGAINNIGARYLMATREYAGYATDNWRITPRLTLTLGVRYEYEYVPVNAVPNPLFEGQTAVGSYFPNTLSKPDDRNNVAPRLGFALNVFGDGKTTLRGGYGIYFGRIINANVEQSYQNSGGPNSQVNISGLFPDASYLPNNANPAQSLADCTIIFPHVVTTYAQAQRCASSTNNASSHPSISYLDSHLQNPQVHEADLALEQDLGHGWIFGITYMGSFGRELDSANDVNVNLAYSQTSTFYVNNTIGISPPTPAVALPHGGKVAPLPQGPVQVRTYGTNPQGVRNPNPRYNANYYRILRIASNVNSKYNALAFQINKRYSNGFSLLSNYTWSHALDYNPYIGTGIPGPTQLDPADQSKDYGNSSLDVRSRFVGAVVYQPQTHFHGITDAFLGGWRIAPVVQAQTGLPYTPYVSGYPMESVSGVRSPNGAGGTSGRVDPIRRNQDYRPITVKADVRLGKNFYFDVNHYGLGRVRLEFLAEAFNVLNHQNITGIQTTAYNLAYGTLAGVTPGSTLTSTGTSGGAISDILTLQPNFGTYNNSNSNYTYTPRQIQLAARLHF